MTLHFLRPWWLTALIPCVYLVWSIMQTRGSTTAWQRACDPHLLPHLLTKPQQAQRGLPIVILSLAWMLTVLALGGPTWSRTPTAVYRSVVSRVIVLDVSPAMLARDLKPSRMERAKFKVRDLLSAMDDGQVGMVAFSQRGFVVSPLTQDAATIAAMIPELNPGMMPVGGYNIANSLQKALQLLQQAGAHSGQIILITANTPTKHDVDVARQLRKQGYQLNVLGIGTTQGAPIPSEQGFLQNQQGSIVTSRLNPSALENLATLGGGSYRTFTNTDTDVKSLLQTSLSLSQHAEKTQRKLSSWRDQGRWLVLVCLPLAAFGFRRGWL